MCERREISILTIATEIPNSRREFGMTNGFALGSLLSGHNPGCQYAHLKGHYGSRASTMAVQRFSCC